MPASDGLFLGNEARRWDGSKLKGVPFFANYPTLTGYIYPVAEVGSWSTYSDFPANSLRADLFILTRRSCVANYHGLYITGAGGAGAKIRLGIYRDNGQLTPGTLLNDIGEVSAETAGWKEIYKVVTFEEPGYYWLVWVSNDGTIDVHYSVTYLAGVWGAPSRYASFAYGALPATFPTPISDWGGVTRRYMHLTSYQ